LFATCLIIAIPTFSAFFTYAYIHPEYFVDFSPAGFQARVVNLAFLMPSGFFDVLGFLKNPARKISGLFGYFAVGNA